MVVATAPISSIGSVVSVSASAPVVASLPVVFVALPVSTRSGRYGCAASDYGPLSALSTQAEG